ncbi:MAG: GxxExxY protein [Bacteroidales bacterium]
MLLYEDETQKIISAFYEVYNNLGGGFLECVYQDALSIEFISRNIPFEKESKMNIYYKNQLLDRYYFADFKCYNKIIIETKSVSNLAPEHTAQVLNYLKATNIRLGLLVNFGPNKIEFKRIVR